ISRVSNEHPAYKPDLDIHGTRRKPGRSWSLLSFHRKSSCVAIPTNRSSCEFLAIREPFRR
ncbi:hypothetical protein HDU99_005571, partial [Rhizoclosmatium hyalinum]